MPTVVGTPLSQLSLFKTTGAPVEEAVRLTPLPAQTLGEEGVKVGVVGAAETVTILVAAQPETVYDITDVPDATPYAVELVPLVGFTVAIVVDTLLQVPPEVASVKAVDAPGQKAVVPPLMAAGPATIVTVCVAEVREPAVIQPEVGHDITQK